MAAEIGNRRLLNAFVQERIREYGRDGHGRALLHYIAMWQPGWFLEDFISTKSPIIDVRDRSGRTPLAYAALYNNDSALITLAKHGANIDCKDNGGSTPLHLALKGSSASTSTLLVDLGASRTNLDGFGQTILHVGFRSPVLEIMSKALELTMEYPEPKSKRTETTEPSTVKRMIRKRDRFGKTALHRLCATQRRNQDLGREDPVFRSVQVLMRHGADCNAQDNAGSTPAHMAATWNNYPALDALLDFAPRLDVVDGHGCTALDWALAHGLVALADMMRDEGAVETTQWDHKLVAYRPNHLRREETKTYDADSWSLVWIYTTSRDYHRMYSGYQ